MVATGLDRLGEWCVDDEELGASKFSMLKTDDLRGGWWSLLSLDIRFEAIFDEIIETAPGCWTLPTRACSKVDTDGTLFAANDVQPAIGSNWQTLNVRCLLGYIRRAISDVPDGFHYS